jgi:hypothetical protein
MWAGVDIERPIRIRPSISVKEFTIWAFFSHLRIVNVVQLPPQDSFTRAFFVEKNSGWFRRSAGS